MKISIYPFLLGLTNAGYNKCYQEEKDRVSNAIQSCKMKSMSTISSKYRRIFNISPRTLDRQKTALRNQLCSKTLSTYEPNGLIGDIPAEWGCESDRLALEIQKELEKDPLVFDTGRDVYNIVIVGETGAGKSYFANGLLGAKYPGRRGTLFTVRGGQGSQTQSLAVGSGTLFGGRYDRELGLEKSIKINVFDTPGFMDSNIDNVRKNKLLIATAIKKEIDMLIIMTSNGRFDESVQNTLRMLNDWTAGGLWGNTVLTMGRFSFQPDQVADRAFSAEPLTMFETKKNTKHVDFLLNRNARENWTRKTFEAGKLTETPLKRSDFEKLRISLLNMSQISKCLTDTAASEPGSNCWKLPRFEDSNYITDYNDYDVELSDKFAFIEEAKLFAKMLQEMKRHPIKPAAQIFSSELSKDIKNFESFDTKIQQLEEQLEIKQNEEEKKAYQKCENENQLDTDECVYWSSWSAWPGCDTSCGSSYQVSRSRSCKQQKDGRIINKSSSECEDNFDNSAGETKWCIRSACPPKDNRLIRGWAGKYLGRWG